MWLLCRGGLCHNVTIVKNQALYATMLRLVEPAVPLQESDVPSPAQWRDLLVREQATIQRLRDDLATDALVKSVRRNERVVDFIYFLFHETTLSMKEAVALLGLPVTAKTKSLYPLLKDPDFQARPDMFERHPDMWAEVMAVATAPSESVRIANTVTLLDKVDSLLTARNSDQPLSPEDVAVAQWFLKRTPFSVAQIADELLCEPAMLHQALASTGVEPELLYRPDAAVAAAPTAQTFANVKDYYLSKKSPEVLIELEKLWNTEDLYLIDIVAKLNEKFIDRWNGLLISKSYVSIIAKQFDGKKILYRGEERLLTMQSKKGLHAVGRSRPSSAPEIQAPVALPADTARDATWQAVLVAAAQQGLGLIDAARLLREKGFSDIPPAELRTTLQELFMPKPDPLQQRLPMELPRHNLPRKTNRYTLIDTRHQGQSSATNGLAASRPGPDRHQMDWLATQLQASAEDRANGAVEAFDWQRFEDVFLPYVIENDAGLRARLIELVKEYINPAPNTTRLYGYPFPNEMMPDMGMPSALRATQPARRAWLEAARARAANKINEANVGRVSTTRVPLDTINGDFDPGMINIPGLDSDTMRLWQPKFVSRVVPAADVDDVLSRGDYNSKLGNYVTVGGLAGFQIMTINLAERSTCDIGCAVGDMCFGNGMHMANRIMPDATYYDKLRSSVRGWRQKRRVGLADYNPLLIRAHTLGDFYEPEYVDVLDELTAEAPGHTAWWIITARLHSKHPMAYLDFWGRKTVADFNHSTAIGDRILALQLKYPYNVQAFFSSQLPFPGSFTTLFENPLHILSPEQQRPLFMRMPHGVVCPAEIEDPEKAAHIAEIHARQRAARPNITEATLQGATGRVDTCGDCGYCEAPMPGKRPPVLVTAHGPAVPSARFES